MKVFLNHTGNSGYGADQVKGITLAEFLVSVQDAIERFGEDAELVTYQTNNSRGACYGTVERCDTFEPDDDYDEAISALIGDYQE